MKSMLEFFFLMNTVQGKMIFEPYSLAVNNFILLSPHPRFIFTSWSMFLKVRNESLLLLSSKKSGAVFNEG